MSRLPVAIPGITALGLGLWDLQVPSYWRDESATVVLAGARLPVLLRTLGHVDAVHGLYYLFMHCVMELGRSETVTRMPSVLATAFTACAVALLARRLWDDRTALCAGLLYALLPVVSRYAQEARSYALVTAVAVVATLLLLRLLTSPTKRAYCLYLAALLLLGALHLFALLLLVPHAVTVIATRDRTALLRWTGTASAALIALSPLAALTITQTQQVAWLPSPGLTTLPSFAKFAAGSVLIALFLTPLLIRADTRSLWLPWLLLPAPVLIAASLLHPLYQPRYVLFSVPALALGAGRGLARLPRRLPALALTAIALAALPVQLAQRTETSRGDDLRDLWAVVRQHDHPGDSLLYLPASRAMLAAAYQANTPLHPAPPSHAQRLWIIDIPPPGAPLNQAPPHGFREAAGWNFGTLALTLYTRSSPAAP